MKNHALRFNSGQALVEILVALAISSIFLPALITGIASSREGKVQQNERAQATALVREGREAVRQVREAGWNGVATNGTYHPVASGSAWLLSAGSESVNGQTRSIVISDVYRNAGGAVTASGGTLDPSTKKITVSVSWGTVFPSNVTSVVYVARFTNQVFTQTTQADFNAGISTNTTVTNSSGGEVALGAGGGGNWCQPNLSITALDLPKQGVANAVSAIEGKLIAGTGDNSSGISLATVNISNASPPVASLAGTFNGYKTNDVFVEQNYAYIATDTNSKEIIIVDISHTPYAEIGYFNAPGSNSAASVFVSGNVGYMIQQDVLRNFDLSSKSGSRTAVDPDGVTLASAASSVYIVGNYAYVSVVNTDKQMQIVDISNPSNLQIVGEARLNGAEGIDVFVNSTGTRAYVVTKTSSQPEFFIVNTTSKVGVQPVISSFDSSGMNPKAVTIVPGNKAIMVGTGGIEYQVLDISNENTLSYCGGLNIDAGVNGISSILESDGDAYSYIITGEAAGELKIIEGGPGGQFATTGNFVSSIFDASQSASFNRFDVHATVPNQSTLQYQLAITDAVSGSCANASYTFVGPDTTSATYFASSSAIPPSIAGVYKNPARCFRYKVYLSTLDKFVSPVFEDILVNFSP